MKIDGMGVILNDADDVVILENLRKEGHKPLGHY